MIPGDLTRLARSSMPMSSPATMSMMNAKEEHTALRR
jgi:hypothetical protein